MEESSGDDDSNIQDEIKNKYNKKNVHDVSLNSVFISPPS